MKLPLLLAFLSLNLFAQHPKFTAEKVQTILAGLQAKMPFLTDAAEQERQILSQGFYVDKNKQLLVNDLEVIAKNCQIVSRELMQISCQP